MVKKNHARCIIVPEAASDYGDQGRSSRSSDVGRRTLSVLRLGKGKDVARSRCTLNLTEPAAHVLLRMEKDLSGLLRSL
jgi:hypothetical protein